MQPQPTRIRGPVPYVFCNDAGAIADWCVQVLGLTERERWADDDGTVRNVELLAGDGEIWLDGPVPDWQDRSKGLGSWVGMFVDDLGVVHDRLVAMGVVVEPPSEQLPGLRQLTVTDPEGHEWGVLHRADNPSTKK